MNEDSDHLDATLAALVHPVRRAILERLREGDARITTLAAPFDLSLNAISKHVQVLERAGLVSRRRAWREHVVSFNGEPLEDVIAWLQRVRPPIPEIEAEPEAEPEPPPAPPLDPLAAFLQAERSRTTRKRTRS